MADFSTPFSATGARRYPNSEERALGFPCGAADQALFNGMFYRLEAEVGEVIQHAGLTPTNSDMTQLRKAIGQLIAAAVGSGEVDDYVLMSQAQTRLPFYPEVSNPDFKFAVTAPATGTVRLPGGTNSLFRGIKVVTPDQTDFATVANKVYHLRIALDGTVSLKDLADVGYNPGGLPETSTAFDSTYDDMLVARVTTNSSNIATITNLVNRHQLSKTVLKQGTNLINDGGDSTSFLFTEAYNWARTPQPLLFAIAKGFSAGNTLDSDVAIYQVGQNPYTGNPDPVVDRYGFTRRILRDSTSDLWVTIKLET